MIINSIMYSIRVGAVATAIVLAMGALGCGGDDDDDSSAGGSGGDESGSGGDKSGSGGDESGSGGTSGGPNGPATEKCPPDNPPLEDPFCLNMACPYADLSTVTDANKPMGDCCNTVDIELREEAMAEGETYDLELVWHTALPQGQPAVANQLIHGLMLDLQESGGDVIAMRLNDVPRTADMNGEPVTVTLEIQSAKLNCDGTYSFYGPNAAIEPLENSEGGIPNDPGRWVPRTIEVQYNGFEAEELVDMPSPDALSQASTITWTPRWGETQLFYEQPIEFLSFILKHNPDNWSCFGSINRDGEWDSTAKMMVFIPAEEAKYPKIEELGFQSLCGLFALEAYAGECDDVPQVEWTHPPTGYCDADYQCWIGDPNYEEYADFWTELYPGENGCGEGHPCCDPMGLDESMEPCNAFYTRLTGVIAAAEIIDETINDPNEAHSFSTLCEGGGGE